MENLLKAHKLHLASDRTSCTRGTAAPPCPLDPIAKRSGATANQLRFLVHTAVYWLLHSLRGPAPKIPFWHKAQLNIIRCFT
jgi:hypothetical protein